MVKKPSPLWIQKMYLFVFLCSFAYIATTAYASQSDSQTYRKYSVDVSRIKANTVLVKDITNNTVLYEKNTREILPLASLTKLMTAITVREMQKTWRGMPVQIKLISNRQALNSADRKIHTGGYLNMNDAISYMLLSSSNFTAYSLAHQIIPFESFIAYMHFIARNSGATTAQFVNATGLTDIDRFGIHRNSIGSAYDVLAFLETIYKKYPELMQATIQNQAHIIKQSTGEKIVIENTNAALDTIPDIVLGKTGFTDDAGGNLALLIKRDNVLYAVIVMGSTQTDRFLDAVYLASQI